MSPEAVTAGVLASQLGFTVYRAAPSGQGGRFLHHKHPTCDEKWRPLFGPEIP